MNTAEIDQLSDYALAVRSGIGDMNAFEELYRRHNRRVYSLCLRMTGNRADAEDLAQDVFIQLCRKLNSFRGEAAFTTWLHRLTVNQVLMHFRKRAVRLEQTTEEGETPMQVEKGTEDFRGMKVVDRIALDSAIAQLPPGYRVVFTLHDIEGHEHTEIAKMLGRSVGTSKSQLHKARMSLRKLLRSGKPAATGAEGGSGSKAGLIPEKFSSRRTDQVPHSVCPYTSSQPWRTAGCHLFLVIGLLLLLVSNVFSQTSTTANQVETVNIEHYLDRLIANATVAGEAADVIKEADAYRAAANQKFKAGSRDEARALLRQAGEVIAAAAPDGDVKQQDPLLREYLREITKELVALETPARTVGPFGSDTTFTAGNYSTYPRVVAFLNYFQGRGRARLEIGRSRLASYRPMMTQIFREEGVPEWLISVGFVESTYNTAAHSPKEAHGIWQFIPGTGDRYGLKRTAWTDERSDSAKSTRAAARYLRDLHALFGDWLLAVAAYNWGEGRVAKLIHRTGVRDFWTLAERGLMPQETINYVPSVLAASQLLLGGPGSVVAPLVQPKIQTLNAESKLSSNEIDDQISKLRAQLQGLPEEVVINGKRISNPEVMRVNTEINRLMAELRRLRRASSAGNQESIEQQND